jgi:alanyl-tRNA synthetase
VIVTERLYYLDPYLQHFDATVVEISTVEGRRTARLDRTAFYPTSGGQPFDTGTLGGARIVDVVDGDDGAVLHVFEGELAEGPAQGRIDWDRRFEHMQQHTGQHVLSAAFDKDTSARTVSFHLGSVSATIDLAREVTADEIARAEDIANRVVWEDRPVTIRFADAGDAASLPLRKESARTGTLRLIDIEAFDLSACGGTHVSRTGAIGIIAVGGWEKFRGGTRVEFRCGGRALRHYRAQRDILGASMRTLSVHPDDLAAAIERLQAEGKDLRRRVKDMQLQAASHEAAALADHAVPIAGARMVVAALDGWDAAGIKVIAWELAGRPGHAAVLLTLPAPSSIVIARAPDVQLDAAALLKAITARFGGKGGGKPELAQGGGVTASVEQVRSCLSAAAV